MEDKAENYLNKVLKRDMTIIKSKKFILRPFKRGDENPFSRLNKRSKN